MYYTVTLSCSLPDCSSQHLCQSQGSSALTNIEIVLIIWVSNKFNQSNQRTMSQPTLTHSDHSDLDECPHLAALLPIPGCVVEDNVRGPDLLPGQPRVRDVVVLGRVPHEEHVMPLGDDLTVGRHGLRSLILKTSFSINFPWCFVNTWPCRQGDRAQAGGWHWPHRAGWLWGWHCIPPGSPWAGPLRARHGRLSQSSHGGLNTRDAVIMCCTFIHFAKMYNFLMSSGTNVP